MHWEKVYPQGLSADSNISIGELVSLVQLTPALPEKKVSNGTGSSVSCSARTGVELKGTSMLQVGGTLRKTNGGKFDHGAANGRSGIIFAEKILMVD